MITGPGSPSVLSNMMVSIEQHVDWISDCLDALRARGLDCIEPTLAAEDAGWRMSTKWRTRRCIPRAASWYMGANIPGKPRVFMPYIGGVGAYRQKSATKSRRTGYEGFELSGRPSVAVAAE